MFITFGRDLYGKTDSYCQDGKEVCYVKTLFTYLNYFPVAPIQSYLIIAGTENGTSGFCGIPIANSKKSILHGYIRALLTLVLIVTGLVGGYAAMIADTSMGIQSAVVAAGTLAFWYWSYKKASVPSEERVKEFLQILTLSAK
jgi:hypothetical protein